MYWKPGEEEKHVEGFGSRVLSVVQRAFTDPKVALVAMSLAIGLVILKGYADDESS